jgi:putative Ca2+/H+ antiporter (TMEM165/GDT1 family)
MAVGTVDLNLDSSIPVSPVSDLSPLALDSLSVEQSVSPEAIAVTSDVIDPLIGHSPDVSLVSPTGSQQSATVSPYRQAWTVFGTTFVTIFLAELGDKTQVSTLLMSAESHQPWTIFAGAASALVTTSLLGVLVGCWLADRISPKLLDRAAGSTLALLSIWLFWEVLG